MLDWGNGQTVASHPGGAGGYLMLTYVRQLWVKNCSACREGLEPILGVTGEAARGVGGRCHDHRQHAAGGGKMPASGRGGNR